MQTLAVEPGDLLQVRSTDLPLGSFIKLQPQSPEFLDISDPKAVLENAFRDFACLTTGDIFTFAYNDAIYRVAVLETRPASDKKAICTLETDLSVDFAPPVGYEEPRRAHSGTSTPRSGKGSLMAGKGGTLHSHGTMAQAINYPAIAPSASAVAAGAAAASSNFLSPGNRLSSKKGAKASTPVAGTSSNPSPLSGRRKNGPQPLRLPPGKLFFGYDIKPLKRQDGQAEDGSEVRFPGQGQTLRKKKGDK